MYDNAAMAEPFGPARRVGGAPAGFGGLDPGESDAERGAGPAPHIRHAGSAKPILSAYYTTRRVGVNQTGFIFPRFR